MSDPEDGARAVDGWTPRPAPKPTPLAGRTIGLEPFDADAHADALYDAIGGDAHADLWTFIPFAPFDSPEALAALFTGMVDAGEWVTYVARAPGGDRLLGTASLMANRGADGVSEVGCVIYAPELKRTTAATELQYLLARHVFDDLGYRRYEWKCDARNQASRSAAQRLGFTFEGIFRQHMVVRGVNRDTAWLSMTDGEWPAIRAAFEAWLAPGNFDDGGRPRRRLAELRAGPSRG
jgi:RimJ/RimL family protein N-acetyltransferase